LGDEEFCWCPSVLAGELGCDEGRAVVEATLIERCSKELASVVSLLFIDGGSGGVSLATFCDRKYAIVIWTSDEPLPH